MGSNEGNVLPKYLKQDSLPLFNERIHLVLGQWTVLQMAVENEWGGRESRQKAKKLAADIFSWFLKFKDSLCIDDLENLIDATMDNSFNTWAEDDSVEDVALELMTIHEEFLEGNYKCEKIEETSSSPSKVVSQSKPVINKAEEEASEMDVDCESKTTVEPEDGWFVYSRRKKGSWKC
ncbi:hypothetical protein GIB67_035964 [Kingdonia uniflora]|uniref:Pre-rRNA-processing protein TSR2 homolog n=1 Tax=Kingdonia uniflora TaxID=39325 RepID=A0A7J7N0U8_9MAGN|nr:hypothetical protein GIB67_035964 [Kingdonia uniflora]